jgi:hypothetical protein
MYFGFQTEGNPGIKVVTYGSPLYYANGELFLKKIYTATGAKPELIRKVLKRLQKNFPPINVSVIFLLDSIQRRTKSSQVKSSQVSQSQNHFIPLQRAITFLPLSIPICICLPLLC